MEEDKTNETKKRLSKLAKTFDRAGIITVVICFLLLAVVTHVKELQQTYIFIIIAAGILTGMFMDGINRIIRFIVFIINKNQRKRNGYKWWQIY